VFTAILWPGNDLARIGAALLSLLPALASYVWVEQPIRSIPDLAGSRLARIVVITVLVPVLLSGALLVAVRNHFWSPAIAEFATVTQQKHVGQVAGCDTRTSTDKRTPGECRWNPTEPGPPIYLVGDSNADHFSEGVILAGRELHRPVIVSTSNACPFLDVDFVDARQTRDENEKCRAYVQGTLDYLESSEPGLVVISGVDRYWYDATFSIGLDPTSITADSDKKLDVMEEGLASTVAALTQARQNVMLVQTIPLWLGEDAFDPARCSTISLVTHNCQRSMPVSRAEVRQGAVRKVLERVALDEGAILMDPWVLLCQGGTCATDDQGVTRYRNGSHLSARESSSLAPAFADAITSGS
jgi:hypothetical protein